MAELQICAFTVKSVSDAVKKKSFRVSSLTKCKRPSYQDERFPNLGIHTADHGETIRGKKEKGKLNQNICQELTSLECVWRYARVQIRAHCEGDWRNNSVVPTGRLKSWA